MKGDKFTLVTPDALTWFNGTTRRTKKSKGAAGGSTGGSTGSVKAKAGSCNPKADKWCHSHPAIPGCTDSYMHSHAYTNPKHTHTYGCKGGKGKAKGGSGGKIKLPSVKAKGVYRGAVSMNAASREVMKQYQR